ncbi:MAG: NCS2 family permease [Syntrophomonadaceae bacterium]|nr:NCS2 family permease [Syntrophomonadaceae bacterium]
MQQWLNSFFAIEARGSTVKTEVVAGITTFFTMAYILIVNPAILVAAGMDYGAVFSATALATAISTGLMAWWARLPLVVSAGMGLNTLFVYYVVVNMGHSWQFALTSCFLTGLVFLIISPLNLREKVIQQMPDSLQNAITAGIGLFIASIGLKNAGIIVSEPSNLITLGVLSEPGPLLACIGLAITACFMVRKNTMALLLGIIITTVIGIFMGVTEMPSAVVSLPPSLAPTFMQFDFSEIWSFDMLAAVFTFTLIGMFNSAGTLIGYASKVGALPVEGRFPPAKRAMLCDTVGTTASACLGSSPQVIFVESIAGVTAGGRTGLTSLVVAVCFIAAMFMAPLLAMVPDAATNPALVMVGVYMITPLAKINFNNLSEGIPAFLTIMIMPFSSSVVDGIGFGIIAYVVLKLCGGREKHKDLNVLICVLALLFLLKYWLL